LVKFTQEAHLRLLRRIGTVVGSLDTWFERRFRVPAVPLPDPAAGDEFVQLFTRHQRRLYLYILSQVPRVADAEEILQEANCVMLAKRGHFEPGTNFLAWAMQITVFEILKYRQRFGRERLRFTDEFLAVIAEEAAASIDQIEERRRVLELCLGKLRADDRRLIEHRYQPGSTTRELAEEIGRPANSVYQSLGRIRRTLMECVQRQLTGGPVVS
jgi:RNA polymerase sigma-70 factor (ECF subfamily)